MKSIATINTILPTVEGQIEYCSGESLRDYDIVLFDPSFPYEEREHFTAGGSCLSIEGARRIKSAMHHWSTELSDALQVGKTVFIILSEEKKDLAAVSSTLDKKQRLFQTSSINSYEVLPIRINVRNTKGKQIRVVDSAYKGLYEALKEVAQYKAIIVTEIGEKIYTANDGAIVGAVVEFDNMPGKMVLLPYFNLNEYDKSTTEEWLKETLNISRAIVNQLIALDDFLRKGRCQTPSPEWIDSIVRPKKSAKIDETIKTIEKKIEALEQEKEAELKSKDSLLEFSSLLYENAKSLETAIENSLRLLGYKVENYRNGDLEIDHIIISPEGMRMIGESEGKDNSAIDISKFRQLESNINEDFERDDVDAPAKGILFGNGFRLTIPEKREEQFTQKCLTNAKRLNVALVRSADLYKTIVYVLDNPADEIFKKACRQAIESTAGKIVNFPTPRHITKARKSKKGDV